MTYGSDFQDDDLVIALSSLRQFCIGEAEIDSGKSFVDFYNRTFDTLKAYSLQKPSRYFSDKLSELSVVTVGEMNEYLKKHNRYSSSGGGIFTIILLMIDMLVTLFIHEDTKSKLRSIGDIAENLIYVLQNPGLEEMYYGVEKNELS